MKEIGPEDWNSLVGMCVRVDERAGATIYNKTSIDGRARTVRSCEYCPIVWPIRMTRRVRLIRKVREGFLLKMDEVPSLSLPNNKEVIIQGILPFLEPRKRHSIRQCIISIFAAV